MKSRWLLLVVLAATLVLVGLIVLWTNKKDPVAPLTPVTRRVPPVASLSAVSGAVWTRAANTNWQEVQTNQVLLPGTEIKTSATGTAEINFFDRARTQVGPESVLLITAAAFTETVDKNSLLVGLQLMVGRVWNRILSLADQETNYYVETDETVSTVRGTAFDVTVNKKRTNVVRTFANQVMVTLKKKPAAPFTLVPTGRKVVITAATAATAKTSLPLEVFTDEEDQTDWVAENLERDRIFSATKKELAPTSAPLEQKTILPPVTTQNPAPTPVPQKAPTPIVTPPPAPIPVNTVMPAPTTAPIIAPTPQLKPTTFKLVVPMLNIPAGQSEQLSAVIIDGRGIESPAQNCRWLLNNDREFGALGTLSSTGFLATYPNSGRGTVTVSCEYQGQIFSDNAVITGLVLEPFPTAPTLNTITR